MSIENRPSTRSLPPGKCSRIWYGEPCGGDHFRHWIEVERRWSGATPRSMWNPRNPLMRECRCAKCGELLYSAKVSLWKRMLRLVGLSRQPQIPTMDTSIPDHWRFPKPPFRIDDSLGSAHSVATCREYLQLIARWRDRVVEVLRSSEVPSTFPGFSPRASDALLFFLAPQWTPERDFLTKVRPHEAIRLFPAIDPNTDTNAFTSVLEVLQWRASLVHYLIGNWGSTVLIIDEEDPEFDFHEAGAMAFFLSPVSAEHLCH